MHHYNRKQHEPQTRIWSDWHKRVRVSGELDHASFNESQYQYWPSRRPDRTQVCSAVSLKLEECYPLMQESSWTSYNHLWGQTTHWHQSNEKVCANHIMFIAKKEEEALWRNMEVYNEYVCLMGKCVCLYVNTCSLNLFAVQSSHHLERKKTTYWRLKSLGWVCWSLESHQVSERSVFLSKRSSIERNDQSWMCKNIVLNDIHCDTKVHFSICLKREVTAEIMYYSNILY